MKASPIFLLSPARCDGVRAGMLFNDAATFELARQVRTPAGAPLGDVFSFLSGLYFRGKLAYARAFGAESLVMTSNRGFVPWDVPVTIADLAAMRDVPIDPVEPRYTGPLVHTAEELLGRVPAHARIVLLGSLANPKYIEPLQGVFGDRLLFPTSFVGRGDMSRGSLLLRAVREGAELDYSSIADLEAIAPARRATRVASSQG